MYKSIAFYRALGFESKQRWSNHYAQLVVPGLIIGLHSSENPGSVLGSGNLSIGLSVDDLDQAKALLDSLSIKANFRQEEGGQFLHFSDPDGTALYFIKPKG